MNYLRFRKLYQADNDGTFWPGYIELPDNDTEVEPEETNNKKNFNLLSNPRVYTVSYTHLTLPTNVAV